MPDTLWDGAVNLGAGSFAPKRTPRSRVSQACERCKTSKLRCDNKQPACLRCETKGVQCIRINTDKRGITPLSVLLFIAIRISGLMLESQWVAELDVRATFGSSGRHPTSYGRLGFSISNTNSNINIQSGANRIIPTQYPTRKIDEVPNWRLTPEKLTEMQKAIADAPTPWTELAIPMFAKPQILLLVESFCDEVHLIVPLFERNVLLLSYQNNYPSDASTWDPARWACLNAVVAISLQRKAQNDVFETTSRFSWAFFKKAFAVYPELVEREPTITSVQALLAMSMFLSGTTDGKTMALLLASAARMVQMLGIHREQSNAGLDIETVQGNRRAFWVTFLLEQAAASLLGLPSAMVQDDFGVPYPEDAIKEPHVTSHSKETSDWDCSRMRLNLSIFEFKAANLLSRGTVPKIEALRLQADLEMWRQQMPPSIRPGEPGFVTDQVPVVMLHCAFYNTMNLINGALLKSTSTPRDDMEPARATIRLCQKITSICYTDFWRILYYLLTAIFTLLRRVLEVPSDLNNVGDVGLIGSFVRFLQMLEIQGCDLRRLLNFSMLIESIAKFAMSRHLQGPQQEEGHASINADEAIQNLKRLLRDSDPAQLARGLMYNSAAAKGEATRILADVFGSDARDLGGFISVAPTCLCPSTYGFGRK
ncbi:ABC-transporter-regulating transcription factor [Paramyrothecium foliicola]|nr:ABC-transporter-regulating transcription factor [Paramyrothecium foliicola]